MTPLAQFLEAHAHVARLRVVAVIGSTPRAEGTEMYVSPSAAHDTIGGGKLEHEGIAEARRCLAEGISTAVHEVTLGPDTGQCCGGRVRYEVSVMDADMRAAALAREETIRDGWPLVLIFGAGHVGRALASALALMPLRIALIDSRQDQLAMAPTSVEHRLTPLPEAELASAPPGSAAVVMTHDHGLDYLITEEALKRGDLAYVGMIGSATKRARLESRCRKAGVPLDALTCPIGAGGSADKRPAIIAAAVAAELAATLF
ncbi:xanthine dehydrogenase accessory protein XdhC [Mesobacterium pallidum]|uniref:xanthine dehydrogenase accessory protein XdhC n=1 Tax=Mesobacterium pallidum TaxID=2872037 RepID=UPI001EE1C25E|nr:xanthine dehydrogenase accessory protein XdhC [Mesobacterium pallidum]